MKGCNGACEQGRRFCPHPVACELPEPPDERSLFLDVLLDILKVCSVLFALFTILVLGSAWWPR